MQFTCRFLSAASAYNHCLFFMKLLLQMYLKMYYCWWCIFKDTLFTLKIMLICTCFIYANEYIRNPEMEDGTSIAVNMFASNSIDTTYCRTSAGRTWRGNYCCIMVKYCILLVWLLRCDVHVTVVLQTL